MRRFVRVTLCVLLVLALVAPHGGLVSAMTRLYPSESAYPQIREQSEQALKAVSAYSEGPFPMSVFVRFTDGEWADLSLDDEHFDYDYRQVDEQKEAACAAFVRALRAELDAENAPSVLGNRYTYAAMRRMADPSRHVTCAMSVWLTMEEIRRLEEKERVVDVFYITAVGFCPVDMYAGRGTAEQALQILQTSVGLRGSVSYHPAWWNDTVNGSYMAGDFNRDGKINAADALLVLQNSVGLVAAGTRAHIGIYPQLPHYPLDWAEWEDRDAPHVLFAADVNGDGHADETDVLWKYRDLWQ